jgi:hypothetical protein
LPLPLAPVISRPPPGGDEVQLAHQQLLALRV